MVDMMNERARLATEREKEVRRRDLDRSLSELVTLYRDRFKALESLGSCGTGILTSPDGESGAVRVYARAIDYSLAQQFEILKGAMEISAADRHIPGFSMELVEQKNP